MSELSAREVFESVVGYTEKRRGQKLAELCGRNRKLEGEVRGLLRAYAEASSLLDRSPVDRFVSVETSKSGDLVGDYKLLKLIGEGGFGQVFEAQQKQPIRRKVAVKLIKPGLATTEVLSRFETEKQVMALMSHSGIAKALDSGSTKSGNPFFVMELVDGTPITDFCDRERLGSSERIELFIDVCKAIRHAHQNGVLHRDIKPSNIIVSNQDGVPFAKVIDFGIAKAIEQCPIGRKDVRTVGSQLIGTPTYMSPEQAKGAPDIDTRCDVYSLGVLLYEILVGSTPVCAKSLAELDIAQARQCIIEDEIARLSQRLSDMKDAEKVANLRGTNLKDLRRFVSGDLDWIVMRALEKDRDRRYQSTDELINELQRFLRFDPVDARPPSVSYRFGKLVKKYRGVCTAAGLILAMLLATTAFSFYQYSVAKTALQVAQQNKRDKLLALDHASRFKDLYVAAFAQFDPMVNSKNIKAVDLLAHGVRSVKEDPQLDWKAKFSVLRSLGIVFRNSGSINDYFKATQLAFREVPQTQTNDRELLGFQVFAHLTMGDAFSSTSRVDQAKLEFENAYRKIKLIKDPPNDLWNNCLASLGHIHVRSGEANQAWEYFRQYNTSFVNEFTYLTEMRVLAVTLERIGQAEKGAAILEASYEESLRLNGTSDVRTVFAATSLAYLLSFVDRNKEAIELLESNYQDCVDHYGNGHYEVLNNREFLARCYSNIGQHEDAVTIQTDVVKLREEEFGLHDSTVSARKVLGTMLSQARQDDRAILVFQKAISDGLKIAGRETIETVMIRANCASAFINLGRYQDAVETLKEPLGQVSEAVNTVGNRDLEFAVKNLRLAERKLEQSSIQGRDP